MWTPTADAGGTRSSRSSWSGAAGAWARLHRVRRALAVVGDRPRRVLGVGLGLLRDPRATRRTSACSASREMPGAEWFPGARLNYAEHMLGADEDTDAVAIVARSQSRDPFELTFGELRDQVARARAGLQRLGVGPGDRVVAYLPNIPETLVAFLAARASARSGRRARPSSGRAASLDRLGQLEPTVLLAVDGYSYGETQVDRREQVAEVRAGLPSLRTVVHVPYGGGELPDARVVGRARRRARPARVRPRAVRPPALRPLLVRDDRPAEGDRPRARRDPDRAPQEPRPLAGTCGRATGCCGSRRPPG